MRHGVSALLGALACEGDENGPIHTTVAVDPDLPVLAGHYPGFPILPGVCLIECAHRSIVTVARYARTTLELQEIERTRFLSPVFPGDELRSEIHLTRDGSQWHCAAVLSTSRGKSADVRLRYLVTETS